MNILKVCIRERGGINVLYIKNNNSEYAEPKCSYLGQNISKASYIEVLLVGLSRHVLVCMWHRENWK